MALTLIAETGELKPPRNPHRECAGVVAQDTQQIVAGIQACVVVALVAGTFGGRQIGVQPPRRITFRLLPAPG